MSFLSIAYIGYDWLTTGLVKVLIIIAVLQLVKKIPDVINSIFGTNIKDAGGLKGRLSSMVGGGLALKALSTLGNVGKLALQAPIAGAYVAADAAYHKKTGDRLRNNEIFKKAKGGALAARTAIKTGSLAEAVTTYDNAQAVQALSQKDARGVRKKMQDGLSNYNYGPQGYKSRVTNDDGTQSWRPIPDQINDIKGATEFIQSNFHGANSTELSATFDQLKDQLPKSAVLSATQKARENLGNNLLSYNSNINGNSRYSPEVQSKMSSIYASYMDTGRLSDSDIDYVARNGIATAEELKITTDLLSKYESGVREGNRLLGFGDDSSELRKVSTLGNYVSAEEANVKTLEEQVEELSSDNRTSEATKIAAKYGLGALKNMTAGYGNAIQSGIWNGEGAQITYTGDRAWLQNEQTRSNYYTPIVREYEASLESEPESEPVVPNETAQTRSEQHDASNETAEDSDASDK